MNTVQTYSQKNISNIDLSNWKPISYDDILSTNRASMQADRFSQAAYLKYSAIQDSILNKLDEKVTTLLSNIQFTDEIDLPVFIIGLKGDVLKNTEEALIDLYLNKMMFEKEFYEEVIIPLNKHKDAWSIQHKADLKKLKKQVLMRAKFLREKKDIEKITFFRELKSLIKKKLSKNERLSADRISKFQKDLDSRLSIQFLNH